MPQQPCPQLSWCRCPVLVSFLPGLYSFSHTSCPVPYVPFNCTVMGDPATFVPSFVLSRLSCLCCRVLAVPSALSCPACTILTFLAGCPVQLSFSGCPVLVVFFQLSFPVILSPALLSLLSCLCITFSHCPVLSLLSRMPCPRCPLPPGCPIPLVLLVILSWLSSAVFTGWTKIEEFADLLHFQYFYWPSGLTVCFPP
jgi:hypothetical protein